MNKSKALSSALLDKIIALEDQNQQKSQNNKKQNQSEKLGTRQLIKIHKNLISTQSCPAITDKMDL